jgi:hypothetical protein
MKKELERVNINLKNHFSKLEDEDKTKKYLEGEMTWA